MPELGEVSVSGLAELNSLIVGGDTINAINECSGQATTKNGWKNGDWTLKELTYYRIQVPSSINTTDNTITMYVNRTTKTTSNTVPVLLNLIIETNSSWGTLAEYKGYDNSNSKFKFIIYDPPPDLTKTFLTFATSESVYASPPVSQGTRTQLLTLLQNIIITLRRLRVCVPNLHQHYERV